jgi:hypothetical protein
VGRLRAGRRVTGRGGDSPGHTVAGVPARIRGADRRHGGAPGATDAPVVPGVPADQRRLAARGRVRVAAGGHRARPLARQRVRARGVHRGASGRGCRARGAARGGRMAARAADRRRVRRHPRPAGPRRRRRAGGMGGVHVGELAGRAPRAVRGLRRVHAGDAPRVPPAAGARRRRPGVRQRHDARAGRPDGRGPVDRAARRLGTGRDGAGRGQGVRQTARRRPGRPDTAPARRDLHGPVRGRGDGPAVRARPAAAPGRRASGALPSERLPAEVLPAGRRPGPGVPRVRDAGRGQERRVPVHGGRTVRGGGRASTGAGAVG